MCTAMPDVLQVAYTFNFLPSFSLDSKKARLLRCHVQVTEHRFVCSNHMGTVSKVRKESKIVRWDSVSSVETHGLAHTQLGQDKKAAIRELA